MTVDRRVRKVVLDRMFRTRAAGGLAAARGMRISAILVSDIKFQHEVTGSNRVCVTAKVFANGRDS
jgi:hypothetical protein